MIARALRGRSPEWGKATYVYVCVGIYIEILPQIQTQQTKQKPLYRTLSQIHKPKHSFIHFQFSHLSMEEDAWQFTRSKLRVVVFMVMLTLFSVTPKQSVSSPLNSEGTSRNRVSHWVSETYFVGFVRFGKWVWFGLVWFDWRNNRNSQTCRFGVVDVQRQNCEWSIWCFVELEWRWWSGWPVFLVRCWVLQWRNRHLVSI